MDRAKRKANLKKLQLPSTSTSRKLRSAAGTSKSSTKISEYFGTPKKDVDTAGTEEAMLVVDSPTNVKTVVQAELHVVVTTEQGIDSANGKAKTSKRTKLTKFVDSPIASDNVENAAQPYAKKRLMENDFECNTKAVKQAPKLKCAIKKTRAKKQQTIKSAFLRNEQLFSEIAAQHCMAENFSPDEMQLALAISKSESETNKHMHGDDVVVDFVNTKCTDSEQQAQLNESIRTKLQKYGFRTAKKEEYAGIAAAFLPGANRRKKSKWANKFTALTLRNPEHQLKKLSTNIEQILQKHCLTAAHANDSFSMPAYQLLSSALRKSALKPTAAKIICHEHEHVIDEHRLAKYFVHDLFPISVTKAGYLLKSWQAIQGRDLSPQRPSAARARREQQLQQVYAELEQYFHDGAASGPSIHGAEAQQREPAQQVPQLINGATMQQANLRSPVALGNIEHSENELNAMIELINDLSKQKSPFKNDGLTEEKANGTPMCSPLKEPPDKRAKLHESSMKVAPPADISLQATDDARSASIQLLHCQTITNSTQSNESGNELTTQHTRAISPDLFADSDDDDAMDKGAIATENGITTFEIYSSDEVKTASTSACNTSPKATEKSACIVDLTQDEHSQHDNMTASGGTLETVRCKANGELNFTLFEHEIHEAQQLEQASSASKAEECIEIADDSADETLFAKLANENAEKSYLNFVGTKQLSTSFHKQTTTGITTKSICPTQAEQWHSSCNAILKNDSVYLSLASTYLKPTDKRKSLSMTQLEAAASSANSTSRSSLRSNRSLTLRTTTPPSSSILNKSASFNLSAGKTRVSNGESSIDLTQDDSSASEFDNDDDGEDNACLLLSDDEINYSIWKANKSTVNKEHSVAPQPIAQHVHDANVSIPELIEDNYRAETFENANIAQPVVDANFSIPELIDDNYRTTTFENALAHSSSATKMHSLQRFDTDFNLDRDDDNDDVAAYQLQSPMSTQHFGAMAKLDTSNTERAAFGIMESYSEPLGLSQLEMQNEAPVVTEADCWQDASFMQSPSEQIIAFKPRSSHKFNDLIRTAQSSHTTNTALADEYDEFDMLVYGKLKLSPPPATLDETSTRSKTPTGFEQLLTADISYNCYANISADEQMPPLQRCITPTPPEIQITCNAPAACNANAAQELTVNGRVYSVRITTERKPDFTTQTEAELLKQLYNFGIKPLKRKQAIKMLEYIYNQTHPVLLEPQPQNTPQNDCSATSATAEVCNDLSGPATATNDATAPMFDLRDAYGTQILKYSDELSPQLVDPHEIYIFQTNITKKTPQPLLPLHIAWHNLICANEMLHEAIIMYETIDLQQIYLFFKSIGYRFDPKDLRTFFDSRCIIFRYDLTPANKHSDGSNAASTVRNPNVIKKKKFKSKMK